MEQLFAWTARRSGGRITITARDDTGAEVKVPNVDTIRLKNGRVVATDKDHTEYELALHELVLG